jgi:hypothetical protein
MKKLLKIGGILTVIGILAAAYVWFFVYNKPHRNYETAKIDYELSASECYLNYSEKGGAIDYNGKVLQITGVPTSVEKADSLTILVFVFNEGMFGEEGIRCTLLPDYADAAFKLDLTKEITLKGFCSGYNETDVILQYCSIIH